MNEDHHTQEEESAETLPRRSTVFILRGVSLGAAYGFWFLARWLYEITPVGPPFGKWLLLTAGIFCCLFLFLGAVAPDRLLHRVWRAIGKALVFLLMIS